MKKGRFVLCGLLGLLCLTSCGAKATLNDGLIYKAGNVPAIEEFSSTSEAFKNSTIKLNDFGGRLAEEIIGDNKDDNVAISPLSVYMGLAMVQAISAGDTKQEILDTLNMDSNELDLFTRALYNESQFLKDGYDDQVLTKEILTNSIWLNSDVSYHDSALKNLSEYYGVNSYSLDFKNDNSKANEAVRYFVKDKTKGLIDQKFNIPKDVLFSLINTLYARDAWKYNGDDLELTNTKMSFLDSSGNKQEEKFLLGDYELGMAVDKGSYSVAKASAVSFDIRFILPNDGYSINDVYTCDAISYSLSKNFSNDMYDLYSDEENMIHHKTRCVFPEFEGSYNNDICDSIKNIGVKKAFTKSADFSPISDNNAYVNSIVHSTKLKVDKKGIEGAALTHVMLSTSAAPGEWRDEFHDFVMDRPFGYVISDRYGVPLFTGIVNNI